MDTAITIPRMRLGNLADAFAQYCLIGTFGPIVVGATASYLQSDKAHSIVPPHNKLLFWPHNRQFYCAPYRHPDRQKILLLILLAFSAAP